MTHPCIYPGVWQVSIPDAWALKWTAVKETRIGTNHCKVQRSLRGFVMSVAQNKTVRSESAEALKGYIDHAIECIQDFQIRHIEGRSRAMSLCQRLLKSLRVYPRATGELLGRASQHARLPSGPATCGGYVELAGLMECDRNGVDVVLRLLLSAAGGGTGGTRAMASGVADLLGVLLSHLRDTLLTDKRKETFMARMGGQLSFGDLVALFVPVANTTRVQATRRRYAWACIALLEAFSSQAGVPVDVHILRRKARFRVCEDKLQKAEAALTLAL